MTQPSPPRSSGRMFPGPATLPRTASGVSQLDELTWLVRAHDGEAVELDFPTGPVFVLDREEVEKGSDGGGAFVLPGDGTGLSLRGRGSCWVLPESAGSTDDAWLVSGDAAIEVESTPDRVRVTVAAREAHLTRHRARPHSDVTGARFRLDVPGGDLIADALAGFSWGTMLPTVVERTLAAGYPDADGYVISTLADKYLGTYPDVDHEFQIKGRLAWGDEVDLDVVRRMIELQLRMMREDPTQLWRDPCAVQPDGTREYHVRRNSLDGSANAEMFLVTGNIGVVESTWMYIARTGDDEWLSRHIKDLEGASSLVESCIDPLGRLWSDVYYEDQVIKDGRETMSAALAVRSFELLAQLQRRLGRDRRAEHSTALAARLVEALRRPLPEGYWDADARRFVDWVDRSGEVHDHLHLLANVLPPLVGAADEHQTTDVQELVDRELAEFQRFPTFLAARVQDYDDAEIGDGGPYDLCAAGRYWAWDAAFWSWRGDSAMLRDQIDRVARQGAADEWVMGERYDMNHVYYRDGLPWHGAAHYYEYPCVFSWVVFHEWLGLRPSLDADLIVSPRLANDGSVTLEQAAYRLRYTLRGGVFTLENLADVARTFDLQLDAVLPGVEDRTVSVAPGGSVVVRALRS